MKKVLFPILVLIGLLACQKDFDELEDTDQRQVTFSFAPQNYLSYVLVPTENGYSEGNPSLLDSEHKLRIEGYCYNLNDSLINKTVGFTNPQNELTLRFKHLHRDSTYHFHFVADVVLYHSDIDYFETWYQLGIYNFNTFYLTSFEHEKQAERNVLLSADTTLSPFNQNISIDMQPITYNGYCILTNLDGIDKVEGYTRRYQSFYLKKLKGINSVQYEYAFRHQSEESFVLPITACCADKTITIKVQTTTVIGQNSNILFIIDHEYRPFVATINCETLNLENVVFY